MFRKPVSLTKKTVSEYNSFRESSDCKYICHAPFTNLYLGYEGKIGVCCYNRIDILGIYPAVSLKEAWIGKSRKNLIHKIKRVDLFPGCQPCKEQWEEKAYKTVLARNYDHLNPDAKYPRYMQFELSNRCNLECIMCSSENSSAIARTKHNISERLYPYDDNFINELEEFIPYLESANFLGGEPFLIPIYYKIWDAIIKINPDCNIIVQTNGTVLNDKIKELLNSGNYTVNVSIDSLVKNNFEQIRKNAAFEVTYNNLLYFIGFCRDKNRFSGISVCFMKQNWRDIPQLINFCNTNKVFITFNRVWYPSKCSIWESSMELINEILLFYQSQSFPKNNDIERANSLAFNDLVNLLKCWKEKEKIKESDRQGYADKKTDELEKIIINGILSSSLLTIRQNDKEILRRMDSIFRDNCKKPLYRKLLLKIIETPEEMIGSWFLNYSLEKIQQHIDEDFDK
ncbi:MAG: radical SAM protein [Bacteroidales bacterium]|jgi:MoaA/NifB/PqqE/SkfB family radical SAM enzyme|nr:radical SAM protein [Bacteroidales bacterium]MDD4215209.1 radical SAM protein [Bacteroidales bacterium]